MTQLLFLPFGFPPSDRDALMNFDRTVCEILDPGDQFARPCESWEIPPQIPEQEKFNVSIVRKISDEVRMRRYVRVTCLDVNKPQVIALGTKENSCLLCGASAVFTAFYMSEEIGTTIFKQGELISAMRTRSSTRASSFPIKSKKSS